MKKLTIATRASPLAVWQATHIQQRLQALHADIEVELLELTTQGDQILDAPLAKIGGKGLFVKELEQALLEGRADIAVHSTKDVPMQLPAGLKLAVFCKREDPRDCMISSHINFDQLPMYARVGTSSLRRQCQLRYLRNDILLTDLRGNVQTRLNRLETGDFDAIVLAAAGLQRLGLTEKIRQYFSIDTVLPAVGQGILSLEIRADDATTEQYIAPLNDSVTTLCVTAERAMNRCLDGGCQVPIAGYAVLEQGQLYLRALVGAVNGSLILHAERRTALSADRVMAIDQASALGTLVANQLLEKGARELLKAL